MGASYHTNCLDALDNYTSKDQGKTHTCYAYAIAGIIVLASDRVHGRKKLNFNEIKDKIVRNYGGKDGGDVDYILLNTGLLGEYRLRCNEIKCDEAIEILELPNPRPIIATFYLNAEQWNSLSNFYDKNPDGILYKEDLKKYYDPKQESSSGGHAIIIMGIGLYVDSRGLTMFDRFRFHYFKIVNSWGDNWANKGFFKVSVGAIKFKFYDVYWYESDLTEEEREKYKLDYPED